MPCSRILISTEQLQQSVSILADNIRRTYQGMDHCLALVVLEGAKYFADDLLSEVNLPFQVESIKASSYAGTNSTGTVKTDKQEALEEKIRGKHVLLIDDIYDTGLTLSHILEWINACEPKSVASCVLLEKEVEHTQQVNIDFLGLKIENVFAVGYGLDYNGQYRQLPYIGELAAETIEQHPAAEL